MAPFLTFDAVAHFNNTITLGSLIIGVLLGLAGLATFGYGVRWKSAYETAEANARASAEGLQVFRLKAERIEQDLREAHKIIATLEATRSLDPVLKAILVGFQSMEERFSEHENRAMERHVMNEQRAVERHATTKAQGEAHLKVLELIADRLGPDPNGGEEP